MSWYYIDFIYTGLYLKTQVMKETIATYEAAVWGFISTLGVTLRSWRWVNKTFK